MADSSIAKTFSLSELDLAQLKQAHPALKGACSDFEDLVELQEAAMRDGDTRAVEHARTSLEEVRLEIEQKLNEIKRLLETTENNTSPGENS